MKTENLTITDVCDEARKCAVAWGEAKHFDMIDTFKLGIDIQTIINKEINKHNAFQNSIKD